MSKEPKLSYEEARDQLVEVVRQLESGSVPLSKSMELWERGEQLAAICNNAPPARLTMAPALSPPRSGSRKWYHQIFRMDLPGGPFRTHDAASERPP